MYFPVLGAISPKANGGNEKICLTEKPRMRKASGVFAFFWGAQPQARHQRGRVSRLARVVKTTHLVANSTSLP